MLVKVINANASQAIIHRGQALILVRGEMDAGGGPAGKVHLFHGVFHVPVCWSGSAVDFTIKELRTLEFPQWCGLAAFTFGIAVIPDEVRALIEKIQ
jgi:hypothetical protein